MQNEKPAFCFITQKVNFHECVLETMFFMIISCLSQDQHNTNYTKTITNSHPCLGIPLYLKNIASKALPSHTIIASEFYSTYPQDVVQVLCLPPTTLNLSMNAFVHPYLVFYVVFISRIIFFLLITSILILILRAVCTHTGGRYYIHDICIVFCEYKILYLFLQLI